MRPSSVLLAVALWPATAAAAAAHAVLERAEPKVGGTVRSPPPEVRLWFSERLEPAFTRIEVIDADGHRVDRGDGRVEQAGSAQLRLALPPLPPGRYRVAWHAVSAGGHVTEGDFAFEVAQ